MGRVGGLMFLSLLSITLLASYNGKTRGSTLGTRGSSLVIRLSGEGTRLSSVVNTFGRMRRNFHRVGRTRGHMSLRDNSVHRGDTSGVGRSVHFVDRGLRSGHRRVTGLRGRLGGDRCGSTRLGGTMTGLAGRLRTGRRRVRALRTRLTSGGVHVTRLSSTITNLDRGMDRLATRGRTGTTAMTDRSGTLGTT